MALTLNATYNDDFGRVQITISGAATDADYAKVEWSKDQITWTTVRGGDAVALSAGAGKIDHYDGFVFGIPNYYRVTAVDSALVQPVGNGTFTTGNNATLNPPLPAGLAAGNIMILNVSHRNTAATITTPTGWTRLAGGAGHLETFYRVYQAGDTAPSVAFSGGSAGDSCSAQIRAFSNGQAPVHIALQSNASAQDVVYPGGASGRTNTVWVMDAWKQASGTTSSTAPSLFGDQQGGSNTAGANGETHISWRTAAETNLNSFSSGVSLWTGGSAAISKVRLMYVPARDFTDQGTVSLTPVLPNANLKPYWLMNPGRPGQNLRVEITDCSDITQSGKTGVFEVLGRSVPVVVTDNMQSDTFTFDIDAANKQEAKELAGRLALGETMYLLVADPLDDMDTVYFATLSVNRKRDTLRGSWTVSVQARVTAQPAPAVYGITYTWQDVTNNYATWSALVADPANPTWAAVPDKVSTSVIVVS